MYDVGDNADLKLSENNINGIIVMMADRLTICTSHVDRGAQTVRTIIIRATLYSDIATWYPQNLTRGNTATDLETNLKLFNISRAFSEVFFSALSSHSFLRYV